LSFSLRGRAVAAALLILGSMVLPFVAAPAAAAVGVRANAGGSQVISVGDTAIVDGSRSYTLSGNNLTYKWDFNQSDGIQEDATGVLASHQYNDTGIYTVTLTASDGAQSDTDTTQVVVTATNGTIPGVPNLPPVARPPLTQQGFQNVSMVFDGTRSFDPNGDNLTYEWDFDELDGLTPGGDAQGAVVSWIYYQAGVYNVTMVVADGQGGSDSGRTTALILPDNGTLIPGVNVPPVAVADGDQIGQVDTSFQFNANRSFDLDGDEMVFTWDFNSEDGSSQHMDATGELVYHTFRDTGLYNVTLRAADPQGEDTDTLRVIVTDVSGGVPGVSDLPAIAIITDPFPGSRFNIGDPVHFNASRSFDPEGANFGCTWTENALTSAGAQFTGCDVNHAFTEGGLKEIVLEVQPTTGPSGFNQVTIFVNETGGGPINRQPSGMIEGPSTGRVDEVLNFTANFTDDEDDLLNYSWDFDLTDGLGLDGDASGRNVTHAYTAPGRYTIAVSVLDGQHRNIPVIETFNIQIEPRETHAPTALAGNDTTAQVGQGIVFDCRGTDSDGNITLFEWDFDGDGAFDYRNPDSGFTIYSYSRDGNFTATCRVTDNDGLTGTDARRVAITPAPNDAPVADAGLDKMNETQGVQTFFHGTGTDTDGAISLFEWDFDGDGVFETSNSSSGDAFHTFGSAGSYIAVLRVTDNRGARGTDTASVLVKANLPPTANAGPDQSVAAGQQVYFSAAGSRDPEGQITKYAWDFDSANGIQEDFTGIAPAYTYTKGGTYLVTLTVYDALGQSGVDTVFAEVLQTGGVRLAIDSEGTKEVAPEASSSYLLTVTNTGDGTDTISLGLTGDPDVVGWYNLETRQVVNLEAGGVRIIRLSVTVPRGALVDQASEVVVTAASTADTTKQASVSVLTTVKEILRIEVSFVSFPTGMKAGEAVEVTVHILNSGNREVRVFFAEFTGDSVWLSLDTTKSPAQAAIRPGKSQDFTFDLAVPAAAPAGSHTLSVTARVQGTTYTDTESIGLTVTTTPGFLPNVTVPALVLGIIVAAGLVLRAPRRR